jgi:hypothetical protein
MCGLTHHPISHLLQRLCTRGARESSAPESAQGREARHESSRQLRDNDAPPPAREGCGAGESLETQTGPGLDV